MLQRSDVASVGKFPDAAVAHFGHHGEFQVTRFGAPVCFQSRDINENMVGTLSGADTCTHMPTSITYNLMPIHNTPSPQNSSITGATIYNVGVDLMRRQ